MSHAGNGQAITLAELVILIKDGAVRAERHGDELWIPQTVLSQLRHQEYEDADPLVILRRLLGQPALFEAGCGGDIRPRD